MFWISIFESLVDAGQLILASDVQISCLQYAFMPLIQKELDETYETWNTHRIRPSAGAVCPAGRPHELYNLPHQYGGVDFKKVVDRDIMSRAWEYTSLPPVCKIPDYGNYLNYVCESMNFDPVCLTWRDSVNLYLNLLAVVS